MHCIFRREHFIRQRDCDIYVRRSRPGSPREAAVRAPSTGRSTPESSRSRSRERYRSYRRAVVADLPGGIRWGPSAAGDSSWGATHEGREQSLAPAPACPWSDHGTNSSPTGDDDRAVHSSDGDRAVHSFDGARTIDNLHDMLARRERTASDSRWSSADIPEETTSNDDVSILPTGPVPAGGGIDGDDDYQEPCTPPATEGIPRLADLDEGVDAKVRARLVDGGKPILCLRSRALLSSMWY